MGDMSRVGRIATTAAGVLALVVVAVLGVRALVPADRPGELVSGLEPIVLETPAESVPPAEAPPAEVPVAPVAPAPVAPAPPAPAPPAAPAPAPPSDDDDDDDGPDDDD